MSLDLHTVSGYVKDVRALLLDKVQPYRYSDTAVIVALNIALMEGRRLRPDLFLRRGKMTVPHYDEVSGEEVPIEEQFRMGFVFGTAAHVLLRDQEDVQDTRASAFTDSFHDILVGVRPSPVQGGTPSPGGADPSQPHYANRISRV